MEIEDHRKAAAFYQLAAKHHIAAIREYESGNHEKVYKNTLQAQGFVLYTMNFIEKLKNIEGQMIQEFSPGKIMQESR